MAAHITPGDAQVVRAYLNDVEGSLVRARVALDAGDADALGGHLYDMAYAARQAEARAEQAVMLADEKG